MAERKKMITIVVALIIVGALVYRDYPRVGLWLTLIALSTYVVACLRQTIAYVRSYKRLNGRQQCRLAMNISMVLILISSSVSGNLYYFLTLLILAIEYMMVDKKALK